MRVVMSGYDVGCGLAVVADDLEGTKKYVILLPFY